LILIRKGAKKAKANVHNLDLQQELINYTFRKEVLDKIGVHKSFVWIRPEHMEPSGNKDMDEIRKLLRIQLDECLDILNSLSEGQGLLYRTTMTVNNLGKINVYEYIYFLAKHIERHIEQMTKTELECMNS
jgi:hypothetical protein